MNYNIDTLVMTAMRDNNAKRPYLYVNPIQGKHIPVSPAKVKEMCNCLADKINYRYKGEKLLVIGFAETATGIATSISMALKGVEYFLTTTRESFETKEYLYFTESHSHAIDQKLYTDYLDKAFNYVDRIVFIDDEITTGNTICKLIECLKSRYSIEHRKFTIASILNSTPQDRIKELQKVGIDCIYLCKIPYEYKNHQIQKCAIGNKFYDADKLLVHKDVSKKYGVKTFFDMRFLNEVSTIKKSVEYEKNQVIDIFKNEILNKRFSNILIIGSEEFMYPTIEIGNVIEKSFNIDVKIHSTTRSPILVSDEKGYPLFSRYQLRSFYDEYRMTYIYNLSKYDAVMIFTDSNCNKDNDIIRALEAEGNNNIFVFEWTKYDEEYF